MESTALATEALSFDAKSLFDRILVPIDFSEGSRRALATALELRRRFGSEVHLFRLTQSSANDEYLAGTGAASIGPQELVDDAKARLFRFVENVLPGQGGEVITHAQVGADVARGIARSAKRNGTTLVLLAEEPKETIFRTQVEKIVRELDSAVLLIRAPAARSPS